MLFTAKAIFKMAFSRTRTARVPYATRPAARNKFYSEIPRFIAFLAM